jgi:hypothetical protein
LHFSGISSQPKCRVCYSSDDDGQYPFGLTSRGSQVRNLHRPPKKEGTCAIPRCRWIVLCRLRRDPIRVREVTPMAVLRRLVAGLLEPCGYADARQASHGLSLSAGQTRESSAVSGVARTSERCRYRTRKKPAKPAQTTLREAHPLSW